MKVKKLLVFALCMVVIASISVVATLAYFTDTAAVKNTFTVGHVGIEMDEADTDEYGAQIMNKVTGEDGEETEVEAPRVTENKYKLIPGKEYLKDPVIYVDENSEDCWLFIKVENQIADIEDKTDSTKTIDGQIKANGWKEFTPYNAQDGMKYYYIAHDKDANPVKLTYDLFKNFKITGTAHNNAANTSDTLYLANYDEKSVNVNAYAMQMAGFENNHSEAWKSASFE